MTETTTEKQIQRTPTVIFSRRGTTRRPHPSLMKGGSDRQGHAQQHGRRRVLLGKLKNVGSNETGGAGAGFVSRQASTSVETASREQHAPNPVRKEPSGLLKSQKVQMEQTLAQERELMAREIESEKKRGYEEAFKQGFKEGRAEGIESLKDRSEELTNTINDIFKEKNEMMEKSKEQILKLSLEVAKQIIREEVSNNPSVSMKIVEDALKRVTDKDHVVLRLNPLEANWIRKNKEWLEDKMLDIGQLIIQDDDSMEVGGCIIETKLGYIDASLKTKIRNIETSFLELFDGKDKEEVAEPSSNADSFETEDPFGSDDSFGSNDDSFGSNDSFGSDDSFGSNDDSFGSNDSFGSDDSFGSNDTFGSDDSFGSDSLDDMPPLEEGDFSGFDAPPMSPAEFQSNEPGLTNPSMPLASSESETSKSEFSFEDDEDFNDFEFDFDDDEDLDLE